MVKLDDVAKLAGVSKGTASRVLNNRGYISQQTRERIEAAVMELNYYPNEECAQPAQASLRHDRRRRADHHLSLLLRNDFLP